MLGPFMFQSAPRSCDRSDNTRWFTVGGLARFNPRPGPATGATIPPASSNWTPCCFNPRPGPATGATRPCTPVPWCSPCFNPRPGPATGATRVARMHAVREHVSIRAPVLRPERLGTKPRVAAEKVVSIRAPVLRPERQKVVDVKTQPQDVSIRAPVLRPERPRDLLVSPRRVMFQSAPRSCDRSDRHARHRVPGLHVSIRAPVLRPERPPGSTNPSGLNVFQSAPRSCDRSDHAHAGFRPSGHGFNPRPGPATGATTSLSTRSIATSSFNPRPGPATGATLERTGARRAGHVSIRAPVLRPERPSNCLPSRGPPNVSIRAPVLRPERPVGTKYPPCEVRVSIRAPVLRPERLGTQSMPLIVMGFNPRPGPATGATRERGGRGADDSVSIRAPVLRPERLYDPANYFNNPLFQSAPRSCDRSDQQTGGGACREQVSIRAPVLRPERPHIPYKADAQRVKPHVSRMSIRAGDQQVDVVKERWPTWLLRAKCSNREPPGLFPALGVRGEHIRR